MWSLSGSQQPFPWVLGHFRHGDTQPTEQLGDRGQACSWPLRRQSFAIWDIFHGHSVGNYTVMCSFVCLFIFDWKGRPKFRPWVNLWQPWETLFIVQTCLSPLSDPRIVLEERLCSPHTWIINLLISISLKLIINYQSTPPDKVPTQGLVAWADWMADLKTNFNFTILIISTEKQKLRCF